VETLSFHLPFLFAFLGAENDVNVVDAPARRGLLIAMTFA